MKRERRRVFKKILSQRKYRSVIIFTEELIGNLRPLLT